MKYEAVIQFETTTACPAVQPQEVANMVRNGLGKLTGVHDVFIRSLVVLNTERKREPIKVRVLSTPLCGHRIPEPT